MILDDLEMNPDKYKDKKLSELSDEDDFDEENNVEYTKVRYKNSLLPKMILVSTQILIALTLSITCNWCIFITLYSSSIVRKQVSKNLIWRQLFLSVK